MTIGIYKLIFKGLEEWPYVGQSSNIEVRCLQGHKSSLKLGKSNYKLQEAFSISGEYPDYEILEECSLDIINDREIYWINKLNSINNGLNIHDKVFNKGYGQDNFNAKLSNEQIIRIFFYIIDNIDQLSNKQIANNLNIPTHIISSIIGQYTHQWLQEVFPEEYSILCNHSTRTSCAKKLGITYPKIQDPNGNIYEITNLQEFARVHKLNNSSLHQVLTGKRKSCSKWKLA